MICGEYLDAYSNPCSLFILARRATWKAFAAREAEGLYLRFCNMMINDCIHLLDEALKKLPEIRAMEELMEDEAQWKVRSCIITARRLCCCCPKQDLFYCFRRPHSHTYAQCIRICAQALSQRERQEKQSELVNATRTVRSDLELAHVTIKVLEFSTEDVQAPLLLPEMVGRIASMLNYFLLYLAGPERRKLKVRDPAKYSFRPKELLVQVSARGGSRPFK